MTAEVVLMATSHTKWLKKCQSEQSDESEPENLPKSKGA